MIQAKLKLKIIAGYLLLVSFFVLIIYLVHEEKEKTSIMEQQELYWQNEQQLTNRVYMQLLDLTAIGELVVGWTKADYTTYRCKRKKATALLQELKIKQKDCEQQNCIDSICILLIEKERQMIAILNLLENMPDVGQMMRKKIPIIVSQTSPKNRKQSLPSLTIDSLSTKKKKKKFWEFFGRKEKKSVYALQMEKLKTFEKKKSMNMLHTLPPAIFYSLEKEISDTIQFYTERLSGEIDTLRAQNQRLNGKINILIQNFEKKETETFCKEIQVQQNLRNSSFLLIVGISIVAFLLAIIQYIIFHRDVNRRHRYQMELEVSNQKNEDLSQSRRNILLTVSHDLCAPLSTINGYAELILEEKDEVQRNSYAESILHASHHVVGLANNLLYYYRLEAGKEQLDKETFFPGRVMEDIVHSFRLLAEKKGLELTIKTKGVNTMIVGDRLRLTQIMNNLLTNALKFTQTGYVHVGVSYADGKLCFFVRDTGKGISEEKQKNIFKAFERLDSESSQPGFGLGMAITAQLVDLLGGSIKMESQVGHGSTFEVCLPMQEAGKLEIEETSREERTRLLGLKVVLIDDDQIQADMIRRMLKRVGVRCDCSCDIRELIELLRSKHYDLLLTDMQMPEMDGFQIFTLLRNSNLGQSKDIPILVVTAQTDRDTEELRGKGFTGYLHKPFSMDELLAAITESTKNRTLYRPEPDFTALLEGEDDKKEILDMFVQDTTKTVLDLKEAVEAKDYKKILTLIHKGAPLWETIQIGIPAIELELLVSLSPEVWSEEKLAKVQELAEAVELAVEVATKLKENMR